MASISDRVSDVASDGAQQVQDVAGNVKGAINKSVKDQPLTTLIMAGALGFVLRALWKSLAEARERKGTRLVDRLQI